MSEGSKRPCPYCGMGGPRAEFTDMETALFEALVYLIGDAEQVINVPGKVYQAVADYRASRYRRDIRE